MATRFEFATSNRILFGPGVLRETGPIAKTLGRRAFVVTGRTAKRAEPLLALLTAQGVSTIVYAVPGEPTTEAVKAGVDRAKAEKCDLVVGFGGGSAIDAGK